MGVIHVEYIEDIFQSLYYTSSEKTLEFVLIYQI